MRKIAILLILAITSVVTVFAINDKKPKESTDTTIIVTLSPKMHCENCVNKVKKNIRFEKGVKDIAVNLEKNEVTIKADKSKTNPAQLSKGFAKIGYKTTEVK